MIALDLGPRSPLGQVVITPNAAAKLQPQDITSRGDWGELDSPDLQENENSLRSGFRLLSAYTAINGTRFWIITEADRT